MTERGKIIPMPSSPEGKVVSVLYELESSGPIGIAIL